MSWIIKSKNREFEYDIDPNVLLVRVNTDDIADNDLVRPIREGYERELERIKASDATPTEKISALNKARDSFTEEVKSVGRDACLDAADKKIGEITQFAMERGVELDWEMKTNPKGDLEWEKLVYPVDLYPEDELEIVDTEIKQ